MPRIWQQSGIEAMRYRTCTHPSREAPRIGRVRKAMRVFVVVGLLSASVLSAQSSWSAVASQYRSWARMGDEQPMLGPLDCPFSSDPEPHPRRSRAERGEHSRKAFFLYVSDAGAYRATVQRNQKPTEGLTIVKETYRPLDLGPHNDTFARARPMPVPHENQRAGERTYRPRWEGQRLLGVGEPVGLFVMRYRNDRWHFATVHFDGRVETSGAMPQCVRCHESAAHHGVFGAGLVPR